MTPTKPAASAPDGRVVFEQTVESLYLRALRNRVTPRLRERLKATGIDLDQKLRPTYPREVWLQCLHATVEELYPTIPKERAFFELGERLVESFRETAFGPAIFSVLKLLGPRKALERLTQNFRYANNYNQSLVREVSPRELEVWVNEVGVSPNFIAGSISAMLRVSGSTTHTVEIRKFDGHECTYSVRLGGVGD